MLKEMDGRVLVLGAEQKKVGTGNESIEQLANNNLLMFSSLVLNKIDTELEKYLKPLLEIISTTK